VVNFGDSELTRQDAAHQGEGQLRQAEQDRREGVEDRDVGPDGPRQRREDQVEVGHHRLLGKEAHQGEIKDQRRRTEGFEPQQEGAVPPMPVADEDADRQDVGHRQGTQGQDGDPMVVGLASDLRHRPDRREVQCGQSDEDQEPGDSEAGHLHGYLLDAEVG
jgi:hypothetical protein